MIFTLVGSNHSKMICRVHFQARAASDVKVHHCHHGTGGVHPCQLPGQVCRLRRHRLFTVNDPTVFTVILLQLVHDDRLNDYTDYTTTHFHLRCFWERSFCRHLLLFRAWKFGWMLNAGRAKNPLGCLEDLHSHSIVIIHSPENGTVVIRPPKRMIPYTHQSSGEVIIQPYYIPILSIPSGNLT